MKASFPADSKPFFSLLRKPAERSSADCRFSILCVSVAVFSAEKTSGKVRRCGGAIVKPACFAAAKRRSSASATTQQMRQARTAAPSGRAKRAEKESGDHGIELARIPEIHSLFRKACRNKPTQRLVFGWVLGRGFGRQSRLPNVSPHTSIGCICAPAKAADNASGSKSKCATSERGLLMGSSCPNGTK